MSAESIVVPKVEEYLASRGWKVSREVKVRGRLQMLFRQMKTIS